MCGECHKKAFADTCEVLSSLHPPLLPGSFLSCQICRKFIMDESKAVFALKTRFHKECFVCDKCKAPLEDTLRSILLLLRDS